LCRLNIEPDYKNVRLLSQFQSQHTGRIYESHITGLCQYKQKKLEEEINKARSAGTQIYMYFCIFNKIKREREKLIRNCKYIFVIL